MAQTRKRAILVGRSARATRAAGRVALPEPTHSRYHSRSPERVDEGMPRWVSMAEALGWGATERPTMTVTGGGTSAGGAEPFGNAARQGLVREQDAGRWEARPAFLVPTNDRPNVARRAPEQPAPTMAFGHERPRWVHNDACSCDMVGAIAGVASHAHRSDESGVCEWFPTERQEWDGPGGVDPTNPATTVAGDPRLSGRHHHENGEQGRDAVPSEVVRAAFEGRFDAHDEPIVDGSDAVWETRPATTLVSSFRPDVVAGPGYRKPGDGPRQNARGSVRVTVQEAAVLQSFPVDYPWQGTKTKQFQQVGNAIPPLLAEAVLCAVLALPFRGALRGDS